MYCITAESNRPPPGAWRGNTHISSHSLANTGDKHMCVIRFALDGTLYISQRRHTCRYVVSGLVLFPYSASKHPVSQSASSISQEDSCWVTRQPASETDNQFVCLPGLQLCSESHSCSGNQAVSHSNSCAVSQTHIHSLSAVWNTSWTDAWIFMLKYIKKLLTDIIRDIETLPWPNNV